MNKIKALVKAIPGLILNKKKEIAREYYLGEYRKLNKHNYTILGNVHTNMDLIQIGNYTYGEINAMFNHDKYKLQIGHFCSIGSNVEFMVDGEHCPSRLSTFPFDGYFPGITLDEFNVAKGDIVVDDDVWIGKNVIVLSGVHIGQGAIIGAGSVVTKDIEPYAIAVGNPARAVKYRFSQEIINELLKIDYSKVDEDFIRSHANVLGKENFTLDDIKDFPRKELI